GNPARGLAKPSKSKNGLGSTGSTLQVTAYTVNDSNGGGNYTITTHTASGTITKAALDIYASPDSKTYDGTTSSTATPTTSGLQTRSEDPRVGQGCQSTS